MTMTHDKYAVARQLLERAGSTQLPLGEKRFLQVSGNIGQAFDELQKVQKLSEIDRIARDEMIENARSTCWTREATLDAFAFEDPDMEHRPLSELEQDTMPKSALLAEMRQVALWAYQDLIDRAPIYSHHGNENGIFAVCSTLSRIWYRRLRIEDAATEELFGSKWPADAVREYLRKTRAHSLDDDDPRVYRYGGRVQG